MGDPHPTTESAVVVPAIDTASSTAAVRSLGRHGIHTIAVSERETPPASSSKYCDEFVTVPDPTRDLQAYEAALFDLARRERVDAILPFRESDVYALSRNRQAFADHVGTPWPALDRLRQAQDRVELFDAAAAAGVGAPETALLDDWDDWDRDVIVKPRYTVHATEYSDRFARSHTQWSSTRYVSPDETPDRDALVAETGHVPIVQEYVPDSDEYGFFALYDEGEALATFQHRERRGWQYSGGPSAYRESVEIPELEASGRRLLDELDWHGVAMVEFLRDPETGEFELMEVNPRFWSSLPFTVQAGVDFPKLYWRRATGRSVERAPDYDAGVAGHLLWGELLHLKSIVADDVALVERPSLAETALAVAGSVVRDRRFDYLSADDFGPFVRDVRNTLGLLAPGASDAADDPDLPERATRPPEPEPVESLSGRVGRAANRPDAARSGGATAERLRSARDHAVESVDDSIPISEQAKSSSD
ncbi:carboxylate--amine ligase [Halorussus gelatinilyticus]|uniref:Carboxylate--amine ligase n=1 Tax=Halorussus gelatinilyticus TaxID=2937524 RepID=A0A8U0ILD3_9EURY|nr:carboxylate--amine ligase [Halorussus gelatinilyticus]UPW00849.1 carboxylate--amine ligase [Halorussus gelatinilyticus]